MKQIYLLLFLFGIVADSAAQSYGGSIRYNKNRSISSATIAGNRDSMHYDKASNRVYHRVQSVCDVLPVPLITGNTTVCAGGSTTLTTATIAGATYAWSTGATTPSISVAAAGAYRVTVVYDNGCTVVSADATVSIAAPLAITTTVQNASACGSGNTGSATATAAGGSGGFAYMWSTAPIQYGGAATGLGVGVYVVSVTDALGCTATASVSVAQPPPFTLAVAATDAVCANGGSATVNVIGGAGAFTYTWATNPIQTTATASNLAAGSYAVTVADAGGCTAVATAVIGTVSAAAPLAGVYTIPSACFPTIASAVTKLNTVGVSAAVTFNIAAGYTETAPTGGFVLGSAVLNPTLNATNTLTLQKYGAGANPKMVAYVGTSTNPNIDYVFKFSGTDYVKLDGLDIEEPTSNITVTAQMEAGYFIVNADATDGAQYNTVQNCTIRLNKANSNSIGIYVFTPQAPSALTGTNSYNRFYSNNINNVGAGIVVNGHANIGMNDINNEIGDINKGNTILDYGGSLVPSVVGVHAGIYGFNQQNLKIVGNTAIGSNIINTTVYGLLVSSNDGTGVNPSVTITNNNVTIQSLATASSMIAIGNYSGSRTNASSTININSNTITGCVSIGVAPTSGVFRAIRNAAHAGIVNLNNNNISNTGIATASFKGAYSVGFIHHDAVSPVATGQLNIIGNRIQDFILGSTSSSTLTGEDAQADIFIMGTSGITGSVSGSSWVGGANNGSNISNNTITNISYTAVRGTGTGSTPTSGRITLGIAHRSTNSNNIVLGNTISNITFSGGYGIESTMAVMGFASGFANTPFMGIAFNGQSSGVVSVNNNTVTGINIGNTIGSPVGVLVMPNGANLSINNNNISSFTNVNSAATLRCIYSQGIVSSANINNNVLQNINIAGGVAGIQASVTGSTTLNNNQINNLSSTTLNVIGVSTNGSSITNLTIQENLVNSLITNGTAAQAIGLFVGTNATSGSLLINKNSVSNLTAGSSGVVHGLYVNTGLTINVYNNRIANLTTPNYNNNTATATTSAVNGITVADGTTINLYHNTVHLSGTASGVNFGSSALNITSTTTTVTAKNNIFSNTTIPTGVGLAVGHRRASTTITSYTAGSNRNLFYAGTPSSKKLIYFDGTNRDSTFAQYQVRMTTREANSFSENIAPAFISTTYGNTGFLKFAAGTTTRCESGGEVIAGITTDFEGEPRQGSAGYTGTGSAPDVGADEFEGIPAQQIIVSATPILCNSGTAQVTVTATGGSAPYQGVGTFTRSAGTYTFTVTDASGYSVSKTITIQQPTVLSASATAPAILCNGGTVTVAVSATGGTAPYTGTGSFTVTAGTYNYTVTDANGCTANTTITLTQPGALAAIATVSGILCMGSSTTITAAMQGGSTPYQYAWSNGSGGATTTVYSTATYTVTATDNFGCTATATAAAAALPTPVAVISGDVTVCQGFSTMVSASGGVSYIWSNSLTDVDIWISNGIYTVTVTGSNSCTASASTAITTLPIMSLATTVTPTCGNSSNGTIAVAVSGGAVPFAYNWNTGASTNNISSLAAGTYSVTVTDNNGCMKIVRRTVVVSPIPIAAISGTGVGCVSVALTASGGNSYLWSGGNTPAMSANTFTTSGIYTVTASTAVGCTATASTSLTITESATPSIAITGNGCSNLTLIATGGTYYTWSNGISGATNIVTTSGVYTVTVTNAAGCTGSITQNIVLSSPPLVTITGNTTACQGATALVQASGGISYLWSNNQTTASLSLSFGTYTVTATDTNNCTATASVIITALQPPITTISISGTTCPKTLTASGGTCLWNTGSTTNTIIASNSGIYTVTTTNSVGCTTTASVTIDCCNLQITELRNIIYIHAQAVTFPTPTVTGCATGSILTYLWEFGDGTNSILANPVHTYTNIGVYNVCLTITCTKSDGTYCRAKCYREVSIGKNSPILYPMFAINSVPATGLGYTFTGTPQSVNVVPAPVSTYEVYNSTNTLAGTVTGTNATYTFPNSGEYTVCRKLNYTADANYGTVGTNENCRKMTIVPIAGCNAIVRFTATTYKGNPLNLTFNASSYSSGVNSFYWEYSTSPAGTFIDLGSTINANSPTPTFVFPSAGIYWIRLTANKGTTCETKVSIPIRLNSFTCTTCTNLGINEMRYITYSYVPTVVFPSPTISSPANSSLSYLWEFGDGTMSALVNPTHTYANAGVYNVCLTVTASMPDGSSCFTKCCRDVNIAKSYPALYPTFSFSMPTTGFTHTFTGTIQSTSVIPAPVSTYEIYNSTNTLVTTVTGTNATYTFPNSGEYTVCRNLAYTADANYGAYCTGKNCRKITVMPTTGCNATTKFVATTYKANALNVTFNASSYSTGATAYYWEYSTSPTGTFTQLGTAANSILGTPAFLFSSAGIYWVRLTINKGTACETAIIARINLNAFTCTASSSTIPVVARTVNPDGSIEVGNSDINDGIGLYPNPTDSNVTITFGNDIKATTLIRVYDMKGQLITSFRTQEGDSQTVIDLSSQAAGMYLFHIENENGERLVKKVLKQ